MNQENRAQPLAEAHGISGSKLDPNPGIIEAIPFSSKIRVNPDRFPDPHISGDRAWLEVDSSRNEV
jgi:hypothetical protein